MITGKMWVEEIGTMDYEEILIGGDFFINH